MSGATGLCDDCNEFFCRECMVDHIGHTALPGGLPLNVRRNDQNKREAIKTKEAAVETPGAVHAELGRLEAVTRHLVGLEEGIKESLRLWREAKEMKKEMRTRGRNENPRLPQAEWKIRI